MNDKIRISGIIQEDTANGPGIRTTIFTQGCEIHCPGCQNSQTWDINGGTEYTVEELLEKIHDDILSYAVTISGGEPTLQYRQLLPLVQHLKHEGYSLMLFTGKTYKELMDDSKLHTFLKCFNYIKAGPWIAKLQSWDINFRGSTNQRIYSVDQGSDNLCLKDISNRVDNFLMWSDGDE